MTMEELQAGQLGAMPLSEYLLAMGEYVGRDGRSTGGHAHSDLACVKEALKERKVRR